MAYIPKPGDLFDLFPWGKLRYWAGTTPQTIEEHPVEMQDGLIVPADTPEFGGRTFGIEWEVPRTFYTVVVEYAGTAPSPKNVKLQYWNHTWPAEWRGGWTATDDPYNGRWITAHDNVHISGNTWTHTFDPLDINELPRAEDYAVFYRQALKMRFLYVGDEKPMVKSVRIYGRHVLAEAELLIEMGLPEAVRPAKYAGRFSVYNGYIIEQDDSDTRKMRLRVLYPDCPEAGPDSAIVTVHCEGRGFSFYVEDAVKRNVYIPDLGVYITRADQPVPLDLYKATYSGKKPIYDRVKDEPEQSYERAAREIPQLVAKRQDRYVILGCDSNRQEFALRWNGDIYADKRLMKVKKRDTAKLLWPGPKLEFRFPTGDPVDFREREGFNRQECVDGFLPMYVTQWLDREFEFTQTAFAAYMTESPWNEEAKRGDEPIVAFAQFRIRNTTEEKRSVRLWCVIGGKPEVLTYEDGFIYAVGRIVDDNVPNPVESVERRWIRQDYEEKRLRAQLQTFGKGEVRPTPCSFAPYFINSHPNAIAYDVELEPRASHTVVFKLPFVTFRGDDGKAILDALDFEQKFEEMRKYWHSRINEGSKIELPDKDLTDFNRAVHPHVLITGDKDVDTGHYMLGAGTWAYDCYGTETIDQVRALDLRGYHAQARKYLMPWLDLQGTRRMDGRFKTQEGAIHGLRVDDEYDYQIGDYSHDHGTVLWWLAEHYMLTRDKEWLASIADKLVKACDYIVIERKATMKFDENGEKVWEYGLLPECHLDDNPEWLFWYIISALCYRAMVKVSECLAEIGHPEASRIAREAEEFGADIKRSINLSIERAPVVRLADGTYVPFVPVRAKLRGRDVGWIRDALYGPIHFIDCGLIDPNSLEATWILKDYEDNVFATRLWGRQIDLEKYWFSQGGITIQSNLLPNPLVYLQREQPEHAIRAFYNSFAANLYRDVRCFCEHPILCYGIGAGPFYKTPDESAFLTWLRYLLLREEGDTLVIGPGIPRAWLNKGIVCEGMPTYFGPVSFKIAPDPDGAITAIIDAPSRHTPAVIDLRIRHPENRRIASVTVNGKEHLDFENESVKIINASGRIEIRATF